MCRSPLLPGIFDGFSADGDKVMDRLPDRLTEQSVDVWMEFMDSTQTGATTDVLYRVWTDGDFTGILCR